MCIVIFFNYNYIEKRSEVYTLKKTTLDIVYFIKDISNNNDIKYCTDGTAIDEWYAFVIERFVEFYSGYELRFVKVRTMSDRNSIFIVQGNRNIENMLIHKCITLRLWFLDIIVDADRAVDIINKYKCVAQRILTYNIRPLDEHNIKKSLDEIKRVIE
jgi:hypothetical protein